MADQLKELGFVLDPSTGIFTNEERDITAIVVDGVVKAKKGKGKPRKIGTASTLFAAKQVILEKYS